MLMLIDTLLFTAVISVVTVATAGGILLVVLLTRPAKQSAPQVKVQSAEAIHAEKVLTKTYSKAKTALASDASLVADHRAINRK